MKPAVPLKRKPLPAALSMEVTYCAPDELIPQANNPRAHSPKQIQQIARSVRQFGFLSPILRDAEGVVLAGHGRLLAARELGLASVPTVIVDHLTPAQKTAFLIADNKISLNAAWDANLLAEHFATLAQADLHFDLTLTGFEMGEIDLIVRGAEVPSAEPDEAPIAIRSPVSKRGEIWALGPHRVMVGDALDPADYARLLGDAKAHVVFADPPYNCKVSSISGLGRIKHREFAMASGEMSRREYTDFLRRAFDLMAAHSEPGAIHFICNDWKHLGEMVAAGEAVYAELKNLCVWAKDTGGMGSLYRSQHELIFVFKVGGGEHQNNVQLGRYGRNRTNLWSYPSANSFARSADDADLLAEHPTPKNVAMIADALMDVSSRGDIVLDPFLGSGSTVIAAERVGRVAYGLELDPRYVDLTIRRWQRATGKSAVNLALQCTFHEDDLVGHVLEQEDWEVLSLPAIAEEDQAFTVETPWGPKTYTRSAGGILHPEFESEEALKVTRATIGEYNYAGQYQQSPAPRGGGLVKKGWLKYYKSLPSFDQILVSCDTGNKPTQLADYSAITVWGYRDPDLYLLHVYRAKLNYPDLKRAVVDIAARYRADVVLIEEKASGIQLIQELKEAHVRGVKGYEPKGDKVMRLHAQCATIENGGLWLPEEAPWLAEYVHELTTFPGSKHDDMVDATSQVLEWLKIGQKGMGLFYYYKRLWEEQQGIIRGDPPTQ